MMANNERKVIQKINIPLPVEEVWDFVTNETNMKAWFHAEKFVINYWDGGEIEIPFNFDGHTCTIVGEIGLVYPTEKFEFTWNERTGRAEEWFNNTMVRIHLTEANGGTKFTLTHDGFKYLPEEIQDEVHQRYRKYWGESGIVDRIRSLLQEGND